MAPAQTCSACRGRKVRCDGVLPMCGPCSKARKPIECTYTTASTIASTPKGEYLKKGAACVPCRRKKKKCDAQRPYCSTCKVAGKEGDCAYDDNVERTLTEALLMRTQMLEQRLAAYESHVPPIHHQPSQHHPGSDLLMTSSSSAVPSYSRLPETSYNHGVFDIPMYNFPQALNVLFDHLSPPSPTMDLHHLSTPHLPQDLEEFRTIWAEHARQYGCVLSTEKMQAILAGDFSGVLVHPSFVYIAQLVGCLMWQVQRHTYIFSAMESEQLQFLLGTLDDIDPVTELGMRYMLAIYFLLKKHMEEGEEQLMLAVGVVQRYNLTFPVTSEAYDPLQMQEATAEQAELITALAQLIYLDRCSSFVFRVPLRLDKSFDEGLKNVALYYPYLAKTNLVYLRARSLLFLLRVRDISAQWSTISSGVFSPARPAWYDTYWVLLEDLTMHASNIECEMLKATFYGEREQAVALKFCLVVALSGKAQLHWLIHRGHPESAQRALDTVMEVIGVTKTLKDCDFILLDPLLGVCWSNLARIVMEVMKGPPLAINGDEVSWTSALRTIDVSAKKLGREFPFMEEPLQEISEVIRVVEIHPAV